MPYFVACSEHVITARTLDQAQAHADMLNANGRHDLRLCQNKHIGVEAATADAAKRAAAKAETTKTTGVTHESH